MCPATRSGPRWLMLPLLLVLVLGSSIPASAARPGKPPGAEPPTDYQAVVTAIDAMAAGGATQAEIDRMLLDDFGWIAVGEPVSTTSALSTQSSENFMVGLSVPQVYFNTSAGRYEASAWFHWEMCGTRKCYASDGGIWEEVGGYDGFGIRFSKLVSRRGWSMTALTARGCRTPYSNASDADDSGVVFRNQDRFRCENTGDYNWDHGVVVYSFLLRPRCPRGEYMIDTKLAHTWDRTGVSGISVSTSGISVSFSSTQDKWTAVSFPRRWTPCGT